MNEWIWKKRQTGLSWVTVKNILRTMQRVLSCYSKDKEPPFSQKGLAIPDKDKLKMKIESGELFALRVNDINFKAGTVRVDESVDQRTYTIGPCKNAAAYRTILLADREGRLALRLLKRFIGKNRMPNSLVFHSKNHTPLRETNVLHDGLHPALKALGLPQAGMHAFRHGCNRRRELSGLNPAVIRQQMGHSSAVMTARYTGEIPLAQVRAAFSSMNGTKIVVLENMENEAVS